MDEVLLVEIRRATTGDFALEGDAPTSGAPLELHACAGHGALLQEQA